MDTMGVEQGGCVSDRIYRLVNNEQLHTAQQSELGVDIGLVGAANGHFQHLVLSGVGQADDVVHLAHSRSSDLNALLHLSQLYCAKYQVKAAKTKLLVYTTKETELMAKVDIAVTPIAVDGAVISPSTQATHVGVSGPWLVGTAPVVEADDFEEFKRLDTFSTYSCLYFLL